MPDLATLLAAHIRAAQAWRLLVSIDQGLGPDTMDSYHECRDKWLAAEAALARVLEKT